MRRRLLLLRRLVVLGGIARICAEEGPWRHLEEGLPRSAWATPEWPDTGEHRLLEALMEALSYVSMTSPHPDGGTSEGFLATRAWVGNSHIGNRPRQLKYYYELVKLLAPRTICEIGINGGHSVATFLSGAPQKKDTRLVMFDLMAWSYSRRVVDLLEVLFPGQTWMLAGNSRLTVPKFAAHYGRVCDLFSIDGDHSRRGCAVDIENAARATKPGGAVILDDMTPGSPEGTRRAFDEAVAAGWIEHPVCVENVTVRVPKTHRFDRDESHFRVMRCAWCVAFVPAHLPADGDSPYAAESINPREVYSLTNPRPQKRHRGGFSRQRRPSTTMSDAAAEFADLPPSEFFSASS